MVLESFGVHHFSLLLKVRCKVNPITTSLATSGLYPCIATCSGANLKVFRHVQSKKFKTKQHTHTLMRGYSLICHLQVEPWALTMACNVCATLQKMDSEEASMQGLQTSAQLQAHASPWTAYTLQRLIQKHNFSIEV